MALEYFASLTYNILEIGEIKTDVRSRDLINLENVFSTIILFQLVKSCLLAFFDIADLKSLS